MKFIKFLFIMGVIFVGIIFAGYYFGKDYVSNKVAETVQAEINEENKHKVRAIIERHPEIKAYIEEGKHVDESQLPFTSTEEAVETVITKIGMNELKKIHDMYYQDGLTPQDVFELVQDLERKLSDEEILALKAIAYKELYY